MPFVMNAWYVVAWPHEITADKLLARTVCNQGLVLWRGSDGNVAILEDRCCHREMPLAKGKLESGTVRCAYHGLRFASDGACVEIPGQDRIPPDVKVRRYPTVERYGWVWVWPGDAAKADPTLIPAIHERNDHPEWKSGGGTTYLKGNYQLVTDNLLDLTHETFIHATSLGNQAVIENPIETKTAGDKVTVMRWMLNHDPAPFWKTALKAATGYDGPCDRWQIINFVPPANVVLDVGVAPTGTGAPQGDRSKGVPGCNLNAITPETETTTWYFWAFSRRFQLDDPDLSAKMAQRVGAIFEEDRFAVESVQEVMNRHPGRPFMSLKTDTGGMAARRIVARLITAEAAASQQNAAE
jgi:phenylpropionate dioxygenase-like ring-hydroxylating dioxygenase large terminal subunit